MRLLLSLVISLLLATAPAALAQNWGQYDNSRFAYGVSIPPEFAGEGEAANGDGQVFTLESRVARLAVWGGYFVTEPDFEAEARSRLEMDLADGWGLTAQSTTSSWAEWSATKSGRVMHQRLVQLCDGQGYAALRLEYAQADRRRLDRWSAPSSPPSRPIASATEHPLALRQRPPSRIPLFPCDHSVILGHAHNWRLAI